MAGTTTNEEPWTLYFDGSSTTNRRGAWVVVINPKGQAKTLSFKLNFYCTNNVAKYEAFVMGLPTTQRLLLARDAEASYKGSSQLS